MNLFLDFESDCIELGNFEDLEHLVDLLNKAWPGRNYRLEAVPDQKNTYLFIEDPLAEDAYEAGVVMKSDQKALALSGAVYAMIMGAWQRYLDEFGMPENAV